MTEKVTSLETAREQREEETRGEERKGERKKEGKGGGKEPFQRHAPRDLSSTWSSLLASIIPQ